MVGYQFLDDGTPASIGLILASALVLFIGTGYIALDTAFDWTGEFATTEENNYRNIALYVLYQLFPLICLVAFYVLEAILVIRILGEVRPMSKFTTYFRITLLCFIRLPNLSIVYLTAAALLFAIGQIFEYVISVHLCHASGSKINGALFETLFTLLAVGTVWSFWSSITEDDWPMPITTGGAYH